jgi:predicted DNA-binding transcriptional regulator YafY
MPRGQPAPLVLRRLQMMLTLIPREPATIGARDLQRRLSDSVDAHRVERVTERTVQRDLDMLCTVYDVQGLRRDETRKPYLYYWKKKAPALTGVPMTTAQALAFVMARGHVAQVLPNTTLAELAPFFAEAEEALRSRPLHRRWAQKIRVEGLGFHLAAPKIAPPIAVEVTEALLEEKRLRVTYMKPGEAEAKERVVNPLGLLVRDGVLSLVATPEGKPDAAPYQMRLDRMRSTARLEDARQEPRRFDLAQYDIGGGVGVQGAPATMRLRLLVEKGSPFVPEERPLPNQTIMLDGERTIIEADVPNTREFLAWLRGYGPTVKVLGPKELRHKMAEEIRELARHYAEG